MIGTVIAPMHYLPSSSAVSSILMRIRTGTSDDSVEGVSGASSDPEVPSFSGSFVGGDPVQDCQESDMRQGAVYLKVEPR